MLLNVIEIGLKKMGIYSAHSIYDMIAAPDNNKLIVNKIINKVFELQGKSKYNAFRFRHANRRIIMKFYRNKIKGIKCKVFGHKFQDASYWDGHQEHCYTCGLHHMITRSTTIHPDGRVDKHLDQNNRYYYT